MRVIALSDQHGDLPAVPECDLLIVGGDNCPDYPKGHKERLGSGPQVDRQLKWFMDAWMAWRRQQPAKFCVLTWGNHDYVGERVHAHEGSTWKIDDRTVAVVDDVIEIAGLRIWLTPWSCQFRDWAFMAEDDRLKDRYNPIPQGIDILVSHQPFYGVLDGPPYFNMETGKMEKLGSWALRQAVNRVMPKVFICGHIHGAHGQAYYLSGDLDIGRQETTCYNVAVLNEAYRLTWEPTVIALPEPVTI